MFVLKHGVLLFNRQLIFFNSKLSFNFKQFDCDFFNIYQWMNECLFPHSLFYFQVYFLDWQFSKSKDLVILNFENWSYSENCNLPQGEAAPFSFSFSFSSTPSWTSTSSNLTVTSLIFINEWKHVYSLIPYSIFKCIF